ncbi:hypothetical protein F511_19367 [Dorcoceras hygrometricum]|uniref:Uncharacterized protein n=1 Tax=Dorcoceras hygrometricum TaxID=472368 RepID=A0A2Z7CI86_9LAMI|nr:hypothetical protein F511_19367 [Dorcoceras hygrometricum]
MLLGQSFQHSSGSRGIKSSQYSLEVCPLGKRFVMIVTYHNNLGLKTHTYVQVVG